MKAPKWAFGDKCTVYGLEGVNGMGEKVRPYLGEFRCRIDFQSEMVMDTNGSQVVVSATAIFPANTPLKGDYEVIHNDVKYRVVRANPSLAFKRTSQIEAKLS